MAKKPKPVAPPAPVSHFARFWAMVKRHPGKVIITIIVVLGGVPTAAAGYGMIVSFMEPGIPAFHYWVRDQLTPIYLVQNTQATAIDRFLLYQQQRDLAVALADPAAKTSPIVQATIKNLQQQVKDTEERINRAAHK